MATTKGRHLRYTRNNNAKYNTVITKGRSIRKGCLQAIIIIKDINPKVYVMHAHKKRNKVRNRSDPGLMRYTHVPQNHEGLCHAAVERGG